MATITKNTKDNSVQLGSVPYGNKVSLPYTVKTNASGAVAGSDSNAAVASGDKIRVGLLPAGIKFYDSQVIVSDAFTASVTANLGFEYVDGVDDASAPQSATQFGSALAINAAGRLRNATSNKPVTLQKDAWLILTTGGAAHNTAADADIFIEGVVVGVK
jgi:hypothetical protein